MWGKHILALVLVALVCFKGDDVLVHIEKLLFVIFSVLVCIAIKQN